MTQIGTIELIAKIDTRQFKEGAEKVKKEAVGMEESVSAADKSVTRADSSFKKLSKRGLKYAAAGFAGLVTTIAGLTIRGGIGRALKIEDAQAKLKGLGHDTDSVKTIMESALESVKGTAYGLDTAATMAAGAIAAGIKPGKDLTRYLKVAADAATIAGSSMEEMGGIFNKVQSSNKAYNDSLQQLADRGLPIYQWLSKEIGVTTDEVFKLASQGKISSEIFRQAVENNISGAALESGATTRGAWTNMLAAMSRIGERIVSEPIAKLRGAFGSITKWIDDHSSDIVGSVEKVIGIFSTMGEKVTEGFASVKAGDFKALGELAGKGIGAGVVTAITGIRLTAKAIGSIFSGIDFVKVGEMIVTKIIPGIAIGLLAGLGKLDIFKDILLPLSQNIGSVLLGALSIAIAPTKLIAPIVRLFSKIPIAGPVFNWLINGLRGLAESFRNAVADTLGSAFRGAMPRVGAIVGSLKNIILAPFRNMFDEAAGMVYFIDDAVRGAFSSIGQFLKIFFGNLKLNFMIAFQAIKQAFSPLVSFFRGLWDDIIGLFGKVGTSVGNAIGGAFKGVINTILKGAVGIINGFIKSINSVVGVIQNIPGVRGKISKLGELNVPQLATGGIVMPQPGGVLANLAEAGEPEAVIPLSKLDQILQSERPASQNNNNTQTINIEVSGVFATSKAEQRKVAEAIAERLQEVQRARGLAGGLA